MTDVVVLGGLNTDFLVRGPRLPRPGETVRGWEFQQSLGGKGANQAVAAARLDASVRMIGRVGADERGRALIAGLTAEGVDTAAVGVDPDGATGAALVSVAADGAKQILTAPGANFSLGIVDATGALGDARVLLLQLEVPLDTVCAAVRAARAAHMLVVLDAGPPVPLPAALIAELDVIRANALEAHVLTGVGVHDRASAAAAAQVLLYRGAGAAIIGAPGGDLLLDAAGETWLPHIDVPTVDATGAGDAFAGALAAELAAGRPLGAAVTFANAAAAIATTIAGAQAGLPLRSDVLGLLERA
ncbi:MAG: PfkB family carbohydrate kinase [Pseudomonadota bacterium]|nr:PfkB family carbohydrate kinase [Pseudomonadota bacterium]